MLRNRSKKGQVISFIRYIEQNPFLYDREVDGFYDTEKKAAKWNEIAKFFKLDAGQTAKLKWKNLVDTKKRTARLINTGQTRPPFIYDEDMAFLDRIDYAYQIKKLAADQQDLIKFQLEDQASNSSNDPHSSSLNDPQQSVNENDSFQLKFETESLENFDHSITATANPILNNLTLETPADAFGRMVSLTLNRMEPKTRSLTQVKIQELLHKCEFGNR